MGIQQKILYLFWRVSYIFLFSLSLLILYMVPRSLILGRSIVLNMLVLNFQSSLSLRGAILRVTYSIFLPSFAK